MTAHTADLNQAEFRKVRELLKMAVRGLSATDDGAALYCARGWTLWSSSSAVMSPRGVERTPGDDGAIYVLPLARDLDPTAEIICDWRDGDAW